MADIPEAMEPLAEAAEGRVEAALKTVETRVNSPSDKTAEAAVQLSTGAQLKEVVKEYFTESGKIAWVSLKAFGVGALSLIPVLGGAGEAATAEQVDAAVLEGATKAEADALAKGAVVSESGKVVTPLIKILGERGAAKVTKVLKELDPFPDVPAGVVVAAGGAEAIGFEGAGAIPAGIQLTINEFKKIKQEFSTAQKIGKILKDSSEAAMVKEKMHAFSDSVKNNISERFKRLTTPKAAQAAAVFAT